MKAKITIALILFLFIQVVLFAQAVLNGAEYRTKDPFLYGRFEASIKAPGKEGLLTSLFTYFDGLPNDAWSSSKWNEIDFEIMGRYKNDVQLNVITAGASNHVRHQLVNFNPAVDFHTYAFEWTPDYVAWFIDGVEVYRQTEEHIKTVTRAQKLMMNIWSPVYTNWAGVWNDALLPAFGYYDWAAYYKYSPGKGNYGTSNNFTLDWKDEFNGFDELRWEKASHGFGGNRSDFVPENIAFADGKLILCLTSKTERGYVDKVKPTMLNVRAVSENKIKVFFSEMVEKSSAENVANYVIPNVVVNSASLLLDKRTVELIVSGLDLKVPQSLIVSQIKDLATPANLSTLHLKSIKVNKKFTFPLMINVGGEVYKDFISDKEFVTDSSDYGFMEGSKGGPYIGEISNTDDDAIFQTEINGLAKYVTRIPNGKYRVKLLFAENFHTAIGKRIFDVYLQGNLALNKLDIFKEAGNKSALIKVIENVEVKDNLLDIHFAALIERPLLNGIIIESLTSAVDELGNTIPNEYKLEQNYPNPFNPVTSIRYHIPKSGFVTLLVFDSLGSEIATLVKQEQTPGSYVVSFNSSKSLNNKSISSGIYFYTLQTDNYSYTKKMLLLK